MSDKKWISINAGELEFAFKVEPNSFYALYVIKSTDDEDDKDYNVKIRQYNGNVIPLYCGSFDHCYIIWSFDHRSIIWHAIDNELHNTSDTPVNDGYYSNDTVMLDKTIDKKEKSDD